MCASGLVETLVGQSDGDDRRKAGPNETIARWTWLQLLGWAQNNSLSQQQIESLYSIVEGIRSCRPLMQERARLLPARRLRPLAPLRPYRVAWRMSEHATVGRDVDTP
ncbi:hypothetical protein ACPA9J_01580 [Pseudomonas aeruginosa]